MDSFVKQTISTSPYLISYKISAQTSKPQDNHALYTHTPPLMTCIDRSVQHTYRKKRKSKSGCSGTIVVSSTEGGLR